MCLSKILNNAVTIFLQLFILFFLSGGLQAQSVWSKLEYNFNVGSLPPPYHYSYTITINSDGNGKLVYIGGYESTEKNTSKHLFDLTKKKLKILKNIVRESDVLNLDINTRPNEEIPDGGHSESLNIFGFSKENDGNEPVLLKSIPSYPELKYETMLDKLYKVIQNTVPEDIWKEVNSKRDK
jgi:hypothetical protein